MVAVTVSLIGFFGFLIVRVTAPQMSTLFTDLTVEDSAAGDGMTIPPAGGEVRPAG